jgi:hypothetical protein
VPCFGGAGSTAAFPVESCLTTCITVSPSNTGQSLRGSRVSFIPRDGDSNQDGPFLLKRIGSKYVIVFREGPKDRVMLIALFQTRCPYS